MIIALTIPAPDGEVFAPGAFDRSIGRTISVTAIDGLPELGVIRSARTSRVGNAARLTIELPDDSLAPLVDGHRALAHCSIGRETFNPTSYDEWLETLASGMITLDGTPDD